jgi:hypothetical protein
MEEKKAHCSIELSTVALAIRFMNIAVLDYGLGWTILRRGTVVHIGAPRETVLEWAHRIEWPFVIHKLS